MTTEGNYAVMDANDNVTPAGNATQGESMIGGRYKQRQTGTMWILLVVIWGGILGMNIYFYIAWGLIYNLIVSISFIYFLVASFGLVWLEIEDCGSYLQLTMGPVP